MARAAINANSVEMVQQIYSQTINPAQSNQVSIIPRNIGLIKGFYLEITATVTNTAGAGITLTDFNVANILSNITFTDLQNNVRINTTGWHLHFLNSVKARRPYGSSTASDSPVRYGSNWNVITAPATIAATGTGVVNMKYYVPLAYSDDDLRGAIYANVVNATMGIQLTLNPTVSVATGDSTGAVYTGNPATITSATITVYQLYQDQIPMGAGGPVLPILDISTIYELKFTTFNGMTANVDFPMPFSNFRDYLSSFVVWYNGTARTAGTDINYLALQSANFTNLWKLDPQLHALRTRRVLGTDFPAGVYYFDFRQRPIATTQFGNMELIVNPSTATNTAYAIVGYEDFALQNAITQAGSLPT
jgi:P3 major capsid protein